MHWPIQNSALIFFEKETYSLSCELGYCHVEKFGPIFKFFFQIFHYIKILATARCSRTWWEFYCIQSLLDPKTWTIAYFPRKSGIFRVKSAVLGQKADEIPALVQHKVASRQLKKPCFRIDFR